MEERNLIREIKKKLSILEPPREVTLRTLQGPKRYRITLYTDPEGNKILELEGIESDDYILIPLKVLKQILEEARNG